jgi:hypothetical protein
MKQMQSDPVTLGSFRKQFIVKYIRVFFRKDQTLQKLLLVS